MDRICFEFKKRAEEAGFLAGIADKAGKVLYCPEGLDLEAGDVVSPESFTMIDAENFGGKDYILFAPIESDKRSADISLIALKLLRLSLFSDSVSGRSAGEQFTDALENKTSNSWKKLEIAIPSLDKGEEFRLLTAFVKGAAEAGERENEPLYQVSEVASELFPEDYGFVTAVFHIGGSGYVGTLIRTPVSVDENSAGAEECALQYIDTASAETMLDVKVAVSAGFTSIDRIGKMALQTVEILRLGENFGLMNRCLVYEKMGLERLISSIPEEDRLEYLRSVLGSHQWTDRSMQELLNTVSVFLQCDQNSSITAKRMYVHRNTVNNRIDKFGKITGLDCTSFSDGVRVRIALMIIRYMGQGDAADAPVD